jgi:hypothetical protein
MSEGAGKRTMGFANPGSEPSGMSGTACAGADVGSLAAGRLPGLRPGGASPAPTRGICVGGNRGFSVRDKKDTARAEELMAKDCGGRQVRI